MSKENSELIERAYADEAKNARLLKRVSAVEVKSAERPSTSHASEFPNILRERYKDWILVESRLDVIHDLKKAGCDFKTAIEEARVKARDAWLACDFDPDTPQPDSEEGDGGDMDQLAESA